MRTLEFIGFFPPGWGTTAENGRSSDKLLKVKVPIVSNSVCQAALTDLGIKVVLELQGNQCFIKSRIINLKSNLDLYSD